MCVCVGTQERHRVFPSASSTFELIEHEYHKKARFPPNSRIGAQKLRILFAFLLQPPLQRLPTFVRRLLPGQITIDGNKNRVFLLTCPSFDVFFSCSFCSPFSDHFSCSLWGSLCVASANGTAIATLGCSVLKAEKAHETHKTQRHTYSAEIELLTFTVTLPVFLCTSRQTCLRHFLLCASSTFKPSRIFGQRQFVSCLWESAISCLHL